MAQVTVLGAGMMGSALCVPLSDSGHHVRLVGTHLDDQIIQSLQQRGVHPTLDTPLPKAIRPLYCTELEAAVANVDLLVVGVSSAGVRWAGEKLAPLLSATVPVVMITKGLAWQDGELTLLPDLLASCFPADPRWQVHPAAIAGPCIAGELVRRVPTCVVLTGRDMAKCRQIAEWIQTPYYRVWPNDDLTGVQVCAASKNAYAMGMAFGAGLHERQGGQAGPVALHNYEAAVLAQSVCEMQRLVEALGGDSRTVVGLAGVGDLNVTCNGGRTGRFGKLLGSGIGLTSALERMRGQTLECLEILAELRTALPVLQAQKRLSSASLPLLDHLAQVALDGMPVEVPFDRFFGP